jgi:hypothetical protein
MAAEASPDLAKPIIDLLRGPTYRLARDAIIHFETTEGIRALSNITELRDALDHLYFAAQAAGPADVAAHVHDAADHLRRAAVEPAEKMVANRLFQIEKASSQYELKRLLYGSMPEKHTIVDGRREIAELLVKGRELKGDINQLSDALQCFYDAHVMAMNLHKSLELPLLRAMLRVTIYLLPLLVSIGVAVGIALATT